jgi:hypothetical protein
MVRLIVDQADYAFAKAICTPNRISLHPLVYSSAPDPQWSSGYDFRVSINLSPEIHHEESTNNPSSCQVINTHDKSRETRVRFPVEEHLRNDSSSSSQSSGAG